MCVGLGSKSTRILYMNIIKVLEPENAQYFATLLVHFAPARYNATLFNLASYQMLFVPIILIEKAV